MITPELQKRIETTIDENIAKFIDNIPTKINDMMTRAMFALLGLSDRYNRIEIDHCNGRQTQLATLVQNRANAAIEKVVAPIAEQALADLAKDKKFLAAIGAEAAHVYRNTLKETLVKKAASFATLEADRFFDALSKIDFKNLIPKNTELAHPESYPGAIGEILMQEALRRMGLDIEAETMAARGV